MLINDKYGWNVLDFCFCEREAEEEVCSVSLRTQNQCPSKVFILKTDLKFSVIK